MRYSGGRGNDRVESNVIKEATKGEDGSMRGIQDKDVGVCITINGGVRQ